VIELRPAGLYCPAGDFYVDPWSPVDRAIVTHAHPDRALPGSRAYLTSADGAPLVAEILGDPANIQAVPYGQRLTLGDCTVSLHPAGHILGAAQVRIETHRPPSPGQASPGQVWCVSGDYQLAPDPTCAPFEPVVCHTFVTESAFALPIFRWPDASATVAAIDSWWRANRDAGRASVLFANPLGTAQRLMAMLEGPIRVHQEVDRFSRHYRVHRAAVGDGVREALVIAPPSAAGTPWMRPYAKASTAMASGWMRLRGPRRRRALDRGFVLSAHADWPALLQAIDATRAETVWVTGGQRAPLVRWLQENGRAALAIDAHFAEDE